ncbi:hypothetical protein D1007_43772 [Hordeum vulgare]|nr:hypothetical protein D1007_43772 [Hordeum vulgare]
MTGQVDSIVTAYLHLASLELDIKTMQNNREEDRKKYHEFRTMVNKNFVTVQGNFDKIEDNFRKLLMDHGSEEQLEHSQQGSAKKKVEEVNSLVVPASRPKQLVHFTPPLVHGQEKEAQVVVVTAMLRGHTGKELNLDGTNKSPYRHPNFTSNKNEGQQAAGH